MDGWRVQEGQLKRLRRDLSRIGVPAGQSPAGKELTGCVFSVSQAIYLMLLKAMTALWCQWVIFPHLHNSTETPTSHCQYF